MAIISSTTARLSPPLRAPTLSTPSTGTSIWIQQPAPHASPTTTRLARACSALTCVSAKPSALGPVPSARPAAVSTDLLLVAGAVVGLEAVDLQEAALGPAD